MFSAITMASSINRPTPISRPTIEIMLMVMPSIGQHEQCAEKRYRQPHGHPEAGGKLKNSHSTRNTATAPACRWSCGVYPHTDERSCVSTSRCMPLGRSVLCGDELADGGEGPGDVLRTGLGDIDAMRAGR